MACLYSMWLQLGRINWGWTISVLINIPFGCTGPLLLCGFFCSCNDQRLFFIAVCGLLTAVASLVAEHRLQGLLSSVVATHWLSSCSSQALEHRCTSLVALCYAGSSWIRDWTHVPGIGRQILYHWATREVLRSTFKMVHSCGWTVDVGCQLGGQLELLCVWK